MHSSVCTSVFIYESGAGRVQAEQRCPGTGAAPVLNSSPCPTEFMTSVNWTLVLQMENWSACDWVTSRNRPRKLVKGWTQRLSGKECGTWQPMLAEAALLAKLLASPQRDLCLTHDSSCVVEAHIMGSVSSSRRPVAGCLCQRAAGRLWHCAAAKEISRCLPFSPALAAFTISLWLIPGSTYCNTQLQSCPFWHSKRASVLNTESSHSEENYQSLKNKWIQGEFIRIHKSPVQMFLLRITVVLLWLI